MKNSLTEMSCDEFNRSINYSYRLEEDAYSCLQRWYAVCWKDTLEDFLREWNRPSSVARVRASHGINDVARSDEMSMEQAQVAYVYGCDQRRELRIMCDKLMEAPKLNSINDLLSKVQILEEKLDVMKKLSKSQSNHIKWFERWNEELREENRQLRKSYSELNDAYMAEIEQQAKAMAAAEGGVEA